mgnify:CR=1 FL=1
MNKNRYKQAVLDIRKAYPILSIENIKTDFPNVLRTVGINIKYAAMKQDELQFSESYVHFENGKPEIVLNYRLDAFQRRFALARELGHLFLHTAWLPNYKLNLEPDAHITYKANTITYNNSGNIHESEFFAIEFLAPVSEIKKSLKTYKESGITNISHQLDKLVMEYQIPRYLIYTLLPQIRQ